jgi:hypothetical protein
MIVQRSGPGDLAAQSEVGGLLVDGTGRREIWFDHELD